MSEEKTPEEELWEKLKNYDGTMLLHKPAILSAIETYGLAVIRGWDHKYVNQVTANELMKEAAAACPHKPCKIRGEM